MPAEPVKLRQRWTCPKCLQTGIVYCSSRDDAAAVFELVYTAHKGKSPHCDSLIRFGSRAPAEHPNDKPAREREHESTLDLQHPE